MGFYILQLVALVFPTDHIGSFAPCPNKSNYISTKTTSIQHWIEPLKYDDSMGAAKERLPQVISEMPRTRLVTTEN